MKPPNGHTDSTHSPKLQAAADHTTAPGSDCTAFSTPPIAAYNSDVTTVSPK